MSSRVRTAVIGIGYLGKFHAQKHRMLADQGFPLELVAIVDNQLGPAVDLAKELNVDFTRHPEDLLGKVDAVTIAASTAAHFELGEMFLSNGVHVLMEKPLCATTAQAERLVQLAESRKLLLQVGFSERLNPAFQALLATQQSWDALESRRVMPFQERTRENDVVTDLLIHDLDLMCLLKGNQPCQVTNVKLSQFLTGGPDLAQVSLQFADGSLGHLVASRTHSSVSRQLSVFSNSGLSIVDFQNSTLENISKGQRGLATQKAEFGKADNLLAETKSFLLSVMEGKPLVSNGQDGLRALKLCEEILAHK